MALFKLLRASSFVASGAMRRLVRATASEYQDIHFCGPDVVAVLESANIRHCGKFGKMFQYLVLSSAAMHFKEHVDATPCLHAVCKECLLIGSRLC